MAPEEPFVAHGGALDDARAVFPEAPQPWLDLSTGINAIAYPWSAVDAEAWTRLPEASALARLEHVAAARYGASASLSVVAGPGTQALIQHLPVALPGRDVRILAPTYGEFARVYGAADARVTAVGALDGLAGADVAVVVNPNNPDGRWSAPEDLLRLAGRVGRLVVDESFVDALVPAGSVVPRLAPSRMLALRSFGKTYGLAGVRLGFAVTSAEDGEILRRLLGPWPVSGPAIAIGTQALGDAAWLEVARARLSADGVRLGRLLADVGAEPVGATPLFRLVDHPAAQALFRHLAHQGILVRPFAGESRWLRFGLPGLEPAWRRLQAALASFR